VKVEELISYIECIANPKYSAKWDLSGLHVIGEKKYIKKLAISLDPTEEVISKASMWGADFILTHHPTTLSPHLPNRDDSYTRVLRIMFKSGAWLYCAHTSLDVNLKGPVSWLAEELNLKDIKPIEPIDTGDDSNFLGYGIIGDLREEVPFLFFLNNLSSLLDRKKFCGVGREPDFVKKVAYCPGSGMSLAEKAFLMGCDVFISGDLKYHLAQSIEFLGYTIDVGHFILEEIMMKKWAEHIQEDFKEKEIDIEIKFFKGKDPIHIKEV